MVHCGPTGYLFHRFSDFMKNQFIACLILATSMLVSTGGGAEEKAVPSAKEAEVATIPGTTGSVVEIEAMKATPFERRADFVARMTQLTALVDGRIAELSAREAARKTDWPADWTQAMRSLRDARSALESATKELPSASAELWIATRDKTVRALQGVSDAIDKVKRLTMPAGSPSN